MKVTVTMTPYTADLKVSRLDYRYERRGLTILSSIK